MQVLVIGLGQFGMALARSLTAYGAEVIAADNDEEKVGHAATFVSEALTIDVLDENAIASLAPERRDVCVCAIGEEGREASIVATAQLRQLGAKRVVARASDDLTARILKSVGAHEIVNPERSFGERLALKLANRRIKDVLPLGGNVVITELELPPSFAGRTLAELSLRNRHDVTVIAIRRPQGEETELRLPDPKEPLLEGDSLLLASTPAAARRLAERV